MNLTNCVIIALVLPILAACAILTPASIISIPKRRLTLFLTLASTGIGAIISIFTAFYLFNHPGQTFESNITFLSIEAFKINVGVLSDNLSSLMMVVLTTVSFCVQLFSYRYMQNDENFDRYFIFLNLFNFSMAGLILSTNLIQMYMFWELVGLMSYLLIGFWFKKPMAQNAARKAFIINRIGDFALFIAVMAFIYFLMHSDGATITYPLLSFSDVNNWGFLAYVQLGSILYTALCLLFVIAAAVKSAQIPFHVWLVDAMQGPTPVSALIHSATMVGAGIFLLARVYPALILSPASLKIIAILGIATAIIGALLALVQTDIKKILAYSTISQLGFMFMALGAGAYSGAIFHLVTHAYFKALLFLCAGMIIHYTYEQNTKSLGGLREFMPITAGVYLIGCCSLSGILFSGFYSKEMILSRFMDSGQFVYLGFALFAGVLSVLYIFRSYFLIFEGEYKSSIDLENKKPSISMLIAICAMAIPAAFLGAFLNPIFQRFIFLMRQRFVVISNPLLEITTFMLAVLAIYLVWQIYMTRHIKIPKIKPLYKFFIFQFYIDRFLTFLYKKVLYGMAKICKFIETYILDGINKVIALLTRLAAYLLGRAQSGSINAYIFYSLALTVIIMFFAMIIYFKGLI